ncbi:MAG: protein kinase domain-containing protein, partial [Candidatus Zixiibacteriota bacterium]
GTLGTVSYMSPEQVSGREIDHRSDLFSLGIVLYEFIAGRTPFKRDSEGATLKAIIQDIPEPLSRYKSDVPEKLQEVVFKLLEKDRELRYQSAEDVIADLKRLMYDSQQIAHSRPIPARSKRRGWYVGLTATFVVVAAVFWFIFLGPALDNKTTANAVPMIAVLPFDNLGSAEDEYFADGMTEEITSRLAGIKGLGVISRTSSMKYKTSDKNLTEIGRELGVDYILEGSVRWSKVGGQSKVRITPQLVRVHDDRHMWAENYERALMEVFAVQADIATKIVEQLGIALLESDRQELALRPTENTKAYDFYLKALNAYQIFDFSTSAQREVQLMLDSAVEFDSNFALAYALRGKVYSHLAFRNPSSENASVARASAEKALKLQPRLPAGHD